MHNWTFIAKAWRDFHKDQLQLNEVPAIESHGWSVHDAGPNEDEEGIYLGFSFNDKHLVTVNFTEQQLLDMLSDIQSKKKRK